MFSAIKSLIVRKVRPVEVQKEVIANVASDCDAMQRIFHQIDERIAEIDAKQEANANVASDCDSNCNYCLFNPKRGEYIYNDCDSCPYIPIKPFDDQGYEERRIARQKLFAEIDELIAEINAKQEAKEEATAS